MQRHQLFACFSNSVGRSPLSHRLEDALRRQPRLHAAPQLRKAKAGRAKSWFVFHEHHTPELLDVEQGAVLALHHGREVEAGFDKGSSRQDLEHIKTKFAELLQNRT